LHFIRRNKLLEIAEVLLDDIPAITAKFRSLALRLSTYGDMNLLMSFVIYKIGSQLFNSTEEAMFVHIRIPPLL
jgi:hypothetical protein